MSNLNLKKREISSGHCAKRERKKGMIPGVLYGKGVANLLFEIGEMEIGREIACQGQHGILNFNIDGNEHSALLKEVQRDPVSHKIIHLDLEEVGSDEVIQSEVPISFVGEEWLTKKGAILQKENELVKVSCKAKDLPKSIRFDVSKGRSGSVFRYADLEVGEEISIIDDIKSVVASITNEKRLVSELGEEEIK